MRRAFRRGVVQVPSAALAGGAVWAGFGTWAGVCVGIATLLVRSVASGVWEELAALYRDIDVLLD